MKIPSMIAFFVLGGATLIQASHITLQPESHLAFSVDAESPTNAFSIRFDLSEIPSEATIDLAELRIFVNSDTTLGKRVNVTISPALADWTNSEMPSTSEMTVADTLSTGEPIRTGDGQFLEVNVNRIIKLWHSGEMANYGFYVTIDGEPGEDFTLNQDGNDFEAELVIYYSQ